jgi:uncharacterized protein (DUF1501 family)
MSTRRVFMKDSALAMFGVGTAPAWLSRAAWAGAAGSNRKKILVAVFQRGAADGLNVVAPFGEKRYYELRPSLAIADPAKKSDASAIDLDGFFGLHPALSPLKPLWDAKALSFIHATGSPDITRSHFDAQDYMESGTPGNKSTNDGWLNRALVAEPGKVNPMRAVSLGPSLPRAMRGKSPAVAVNTIADFKVRDAMSSSAFEAMYDKSSDTVLHGTGKETFEAVKILKSIQEQNTPPANGAEYPQGRFGQSMQQIARLIKADVGIEVAFADSGGWDTHFNQAPLLGNLLREFGAALAAFHKDLGERMNDVALITMSEFGRTAKENGTRGTDHGHANVMFAMGGGIQGGKALGKWPGLEPEQLFEGRDLAVTTDFRDVLGELVAKHLGNRKLDSVFPGYKLDEKNFRGLLG